METDYIKYRGKCEKECKKLIAVDSSLTMVKGYYFCPVWGTDEPHWWCKKEDGTIVDPTKLQFGSKGCGIYTEFDGTAPCETCGKIMEEKDFQPVGNYVVCSTKCAMTLVGL